MPSGEERCASPKPSGRAGVGLVEAVFSETQAVEVRWFAHFRSTMDGIPFVEETPFRKLISDDRNMSLSVRQK